MTNSQYSVIKSKLNCPLPIPLKGIGFLLLRDGRADLEIFCQTRAENLDGTHSVPVSELLTPSFMRRYTNFSTFETMLAASGFKAETTFEFEAIPNAKWDAFIASVTQFSNWQSMLSEAGKEWTRKKLGF